MRRKLLFLMMIVLSFSLLPLMAQMTVPPAQKPGRVISGKHLKAIPMNAFKLDMQKTRSIEDKKQEPKWLTNLPVDSTIYMQQMNGYETDCVAWYSTLLRTDLVAKFVGNKVTTIKTVVPDCATSVYFWIIDANDGTELWSSDVYEDYPVDVLVDIPCDYVIKEVRNLQVGYTLQCKAREDYKLAIQPCYRDMTWLIASNDPSMKEGMTYDYSTYRMMIGKADTYFGLPFYCVTEGDAGLKDNGIEISGVETTRVFMGEEAGFTANFINYGCMPIRNIAFESSLGNSSTTIEHDMPVPYLGTGSFPMYISTDEAAERREVSVRLKSINGEEPTENIEARGSIIAIDPAKNVERNVVMEEFTGTWCGWCPRGMVAIDLLSEEYGDKFIPIGVHSGDNMEDASFYGVLGYATGGFPSSILNRLIVADPYLGTSGKALGIDVNLQEIFAMPTEATVSLEHVSLSEDKKTISVTSMANFSVSCEDTPYMMSYVLTENGIEGVQTNYYNTYADSYRSEPNLGKLTKESIYWRTTFNHVGRHVYGELGIEGSFDGTIIPGEAKTHSIELEIPTNVVNPENLTVVALLLDATSGEIVNATSVSLAEVTAVEGVTARDAFASITAQAGCVVVEADKAKVQVFATDGRLAGEMNVSGSAALHLPSGNYVVRVATSNDVLVKKVGL